MTCENSEGLFNCTVSKANPYSLPTSMDYLIKCHITSVIPLT